MPRKKMFILVSHEPTLDPRLDWIGQSAAQRYDVTMFGFQQWFRPGPPSEVLNGYAVVRLERSRAAWLSFLFLSARKFFLPRSKSRLAIPLEFLLKALATIPIVLMLSMLLIGYGVYVGVSLL